MARYSDLRHRERTQLYGLEIFEITPIILGGNPTDPENKATLTRKQHTEACKYWSKIVRNYREQVS